MVANPPPPMPPPPPQPNHPHKTNGIRNGSSASYGRPPPAEGIGQAQSSMANMNLHTSTLPNSGGSRPMPPSPRVAGMMPPPPPPPPPGRPIPSTPGRTVAAPLHRFSQHPPPPPSSFGSSPVTMPPAPSTARSTVGYAPSLATTAATPSKGSLVAPSNNDGGMRPPPPPSPMHHHHHHHQYNNPQIQSQIQPQKPTPSDPRSMSGDSSAGSMGRPLPPPSNVNGTRFTQPPPSQMHHPYQPSIRQPPSQHPSAIQPPRQQMMERPHNDAPNFQRPPPPPSQQFQNNTAPPPPSPYSHTTPQPPPPPPPMPAPPQPPYSTNSMQQPQHHVQQSRPPPGPQPPQPPGPPQQQHYSQQQQQQQQQQHHQQQQQMLQQQYQKQLQPKEKIDPSQIPRIPLFTRPHHAPATIYPPVNDPHVARNNAMNSYGAPTTTTSTKSASESPILPPSDARYVTSSEYENASPRLMRSTVHAFPADNSTSRKCDLPLGLVVTPLGGLSRSCGSGASEGASSDPTNEAANNDGSNHVGQSSSSQWNGRDQGEIYGDSDNGTNENNLEGELDYVPPPTADDGNAMADPERVPVLRGPKRLENDKGDRHIQFRTRAVTPPRCNRCNAYLNPYSTPVAVSNFLRGAYSPVQAYDCNMCGASGSIVLSEEAISNGTFDAATRCGTVEYEVGGAYCVRKEGPVQNVHLYGVEYVPPNGSTGVAMADHHHHHHGTIKSHGWLEALDAIREVGRGLSITAPKKEDKDGTLVSDVRIGVFAFYQDMLIFPYLKRPHPRVDVDVSQDCVEQEMDAELEVAIMPDVTDDPFCPLPLHMWTHNVGNGLNSIEWKHFNRVLDSFSELMERLVSELPSIPTTNNNSRQQDQSTRNCGGAALAALASALHDSGGRATLITTRRPNHGLGGLRDREGNQPQPQRVQYALAGQAQQQRSRVSKKSNPYQRAPDEQRLFIPLQRLVKPTKGLPQNIFGVDAECNDGRAGLFYRELGERCARQRICIDIVVTSSLVNMSSTSSSPAPSSMNVGPRSVHPNPREFLDVATLAELCRATCGDFKWLRAGNECGVKVGNGNNDNGVSFTGEQLREELKRSALAYSGSDAVFKLRCSHGVQVKSYSPTLPVGTLIGDGIVNSAELELSNLNSSTSVAVLLEHKLGGVQDTRGGGRKGIDSPMVFFQAATLYTTLTGRRRVRVSTLGLVTTKVPSAVYRSADLGTVAAIMTRQAISDLDDPNEGSLHNAQSKVFQKCVSILANYRLHTTAKSSPVGQLILPESLQLLPLFCLSLRKSRLFRNSSVPFKAPFPTADERAYHIFYGRMISPNMSLQCVHPNLFRVSDMRMRDGEWITPPALETNGISGDEQVTASSMRPVCQLPKSLNPSIACLDEEEMYLLDDRFAFYLFIGKGVPEEKWRELLSVSTATGAQRVDGQWVNNVPMGELSIASTEAGHKLRNILEQLRRLNSPNDALAMNLRPSYAPLVLIFVGRGSVYEEEMDSLLVDDPVGREKSYVDFLCDVHKAVREESTTEF